MVWKRYVVGVALLTFSFIFLVAALNYVIDPYYIFHSEFLKTNEYINERYNKVEYLRKAHTKYNSYIFGSSRASCLVNEDFERYIPNSRFYNMTMSVATLSEESRILVFMIKNGYKIDNIILSVDMDINLHYDFHNNDYLRYNHYLITKENPLLFYYRYLSAFSYEVMWDKIEVNLGKREKSPHAFYDLENSGRFFFKTQEKKIAKDQKAYIKSVLDLNINKVSRVIVLKDKIFEKNMEAYKNIVSLCKKHDINLIVLIPPHNYNVMNKMDINSYLTLLKRMAEIYPFWNFSGYNRVTMDNRYFYESVHFRPIVSPWIADRIFGKGDKDFGEYVTKDNIDNYIIKKKKEIKEAEKKWL
ncbi:MAG: hypothetical protein GXO31_01555 [Epsilonproteobacteria bacterium]|nr:hypothetical protein [Campylobacterota bacterium]